MRKKYVDKTYYNSILYDLKRNICAFNERMVVQMNPSLRLSQLPLYRYDQLDFAKIKNYCSPFVPLLYIPHAYFVSYFLQCIILRQMCWIISSIRYHSIYALAAKRFSRKTPWYCRDHLFASLREIIFCIEAISLSRDSSYIPSDAFTRSMNGPSRTSNTWFYPSKNR